MKLKLIRTKQIKDATFGILFVDNKFECFTLEDGERAQKISGETRIPEGIYKIEFRRALSPKTKKYRQKYPYFTWHLHLQDVPEFKYIYIHVGNTSLHTDGCILVGEDLDTMRMQVLNSEKAFNKIYNKVSAALTRGERVWIEIV